MKKILFLAFIFAIFCNAATPTKAYNKLFIKYGRIHKIPAELLWGIAKTESEFNPKAIGINPNGTKDMGLMQVNSIHEAELKRRNLTLDDLFDPEINVKYASEVLAKCFDRHGFTWQGLNCYNGRIKNNSYHLRVLKNIKDNRKAIKRKVVILK